MPLPLYFVENDHGRLGREFMALDRDDNSRADIVRQIRSGGIHPVKILEIDEDAGSCRDVTDELMAEAAQQREPPTGAELLQTLVDMQRDHRRDLLKEGVYGW
jgi:hypothetical protein